MTISRKIGIALLVMSLVMFDIGVSVFTSRGISSTLSKIGMYSFFLWLPTLFVAIAFIVAGRKKKTAKKNISMKPNIFVMFMICSLMASSQIAPTKITPIEFERKTVQCQSDSILQVFYIDKNKSEKETAFYINGQLVNRFLLTCLDPKRIEKVEVKKQELEILGKKYDGQVFIEMKDAYCPRFISLNDLKDKYTKMDQSPVIFFIDDNIVRDNYKGCMVDENYILKIEVEKIDNPDENLQLNVVRLITKKEENIRKSKEIRIRGSHFEG